MGGADRLEPPARMRILLQSTPDVVHRPRVVSPDRSLGSKVRPTKFEVPRRASGSPSSQIRPRVGASTPSGERSVHSGSLSKPVRPQVTKQSPVRRAPMWSEKSDDGNVHRSVSPRRTEDSRSFTPKSLARAHISAEVGCRTICGLKHENPSWINQDSTLTLVLPGDRLLAAVFDGHGEFGHCVASHAREIFAREAPGLADVVPFRAPVMFGQLFAICQAELEREGLCEQSGTTASCALVDLSTKTVIAAHVGDSMLTLSCGDRLAYATAEHKFDAESEQRIIACGGEVRTTSCRRVFVRGKDGPGLAMSRALGDLEANRVGILAEPEISPVLPFDIGSSLIISTDGVWDMVPPAAAAVCAAASAHSQECADCLVEESRALWPPEYDIDDISAVVVKAVPGHEDGFFFPQHMAVRGA